MPKQPKALSKESLEYCARKSNEAQRKLMGLPKQQEWADKLITRLPECDLEVIQTQIDEAKRETIEEVENKTIKKINDLFCKWASEIPYPDPITQQEEITNIFRKIGGKLKSYLKQRSYK